MKKEVSVSEKNILAPIPILKPGFGCTLTTSKWDLEKTLKGEIDRLCSIFTSARLETASMNRKVETLNFPPTCTNFWQM